MPTMSDWANAIARDVRKIWKPDSNGNWDINPGPPNKKGVTPLPPSFPATTWPFDGFFDWFDNTNVNYGYGYLPSFLNNTIVPTVPPCGINGSNYRVNTKWVFVGLNPNFEGNGPVKTKTKPKVNRGHFMGFNMDTADPNKGFFPGTCGTVCDLWKIMLLFKNIPELACVYECFKGSYMCDFAPLYNTGDSDWVEKQIKNNLLKAKNGISIDYRIFNAVMNNYIKYVIKAETPDSCKSLNFLALGGAAFYWLRKFAKKKPDLFQGTHIYRISHYSGYAMWTAQELLCLATQKCNCEENPIFKAKDPDVILKKLKSPGVPWGT